MIDVLFALSLIGKHAVLEVDLLSRGVWSADLAHKAVIVVAGNVASDCSDQA